ncbi:UvrD-helicase domain-containing protein [Amycolatopsis speibonae]|uniref:DNA 3'-5' helicase n=1 Tax=Amycolatopsis speibonae TaxID=1450224 RepID=A0ABV7P4K3_9PSEU
MSSRRPTAEQEAAVEAFRRGDDLVLQAGAGTGKTTTLTMLGAASRWQGRYLAFNRSIAREAQRRFRGNVRCSTAHALAFKAVGHRFEERMERPRMATAKLAQLLGITMNVTIGARHLRASTLCSLARDTVMQFCYSAADVLSRLHVPWPKGISDEHEHDQLVEIVLPLAERMWADLQTPDRGKVPFKHDHYLKMWALSRPRIYGEFLLLDEAQDTNPVVEQVFLAQGAHAQLVMVGDSAQAIYGWRGARDVMTGFQARQLALSHSFRFGPAVAAEANRWLTIAHAPIRLTGSPTVRSELAPVDTPKAILCRTNGGAIAEILTLLAGGRRVALAGRAAELRNLAEAARDLQAGRRTTHRELLLFSTWGEVQDYVEWDRDGRDLLPFVDVIDEHGVDVVLRTLSQLSSETQAEVIVSTAHAAKGREWPTVRIAGDFTEPDDPEDTSLGGDPAPGTIEPAEARLAYVAVTRAQYRLDLGGLSWINQHPEGERPASLAERRA